MLRNYLIAALRQLKRQGGFSAINIGGFAIGIATCLLIALYIRHETGYDRGWANDARLYRVVVSYRTDDGKIGWGTAFPASFVQTMRAEVPGIEDAGRMMPYALFSGAGSNEVMPEGKKVDLYEEGFTYADPSVLNIFGFPMVYGDRAHALTKPHSMVISRRKADKYFPGQDPVGKLLYLNDDKDHPWVIGGVMADIPANSDLRYDFLLSLAGHELWPGEQKLWTNNYDIYTRLAPGVDPVELQRRLTQVYREHLLPLLPGFGVKDPQAEIKWCSLQLQRVRDMHLLSHDIHDSLHHGDVRFVWMFGAVGFFILLLACINFVNLSTAKSAMRAKEVGLRKAVGSLRIGLVLRFLTESVLLSFAAFLLAVLLAWLFLPLFNRMTDTALRIPWSESWWLPGMVLASTVVGVAAGLYPAFYLSRFRPAEVLKGTSGFVSRWSRRSGLRNVLVVVQFTTSVILIVASLVVYRQMQYILHKDIGFNKDQVMAIEGVGTVKDQTAFKNELLRVPGVRDVSMSGFLPVSGGARNESTFFKYSREKLDPEVSAQDWWVDGDYFVTMGMKIVKGRTFSDLIASDSLGLVINQTMAADLGWKDPIGKVVDYGIGTPKMHIIGEVADFNFESIKDRIDPLALHRSGYTSVAEVRLGTENMAGVIRNIGVLWKRYSAQPELRYEFLDEAFAKMYADVMRTQRLFTGLTALAIVIACLGLFALSAFMAEQRRREVGIRKVLGATVANLTGLLSGAFLRLVLLSVLIAVPVAWWWMSRWLEDYTYRIAIGPGVFVVAGLLVMAIASATIGFHAMRAARANPAGTLRAE